MGLSKPTFKVVLDERKTKTDGSFPLKLRVTHNRKRTYYGIGMDIRKDQYVKLATSKLNSLKEIRQKIKEIELKAENVAKSLNEFSLKEFERSFLAKPSQKVSDNVYSHIQRYVVKLKDDSRISTAQTYECTLNSLKKFQNRLTFEDVTPDFLHAYEKKMLIDGKSSTTVGIYLRSLRTIYNQGIDAGLVAKELYPFKKSKFQIPAGENVKKALTLVEIEKIFSHSSIPGSSMDKAKDFWIFSYLCCGLNLKDICRLRWNQIDGDKLSVIRAKTQLTSKSNQKTLSIHLAPQAKIIIKKWGVKNVKPTDYIFDILKEGVTAQQERDLIQYFTKLVNKYMKRIGKDLKISKPITSYSARHSYATVLKRKGVSVEYISETLGHADLQTTQSYLDSFEDEVKSLNTLLLTQF